MSNIEIHIFNNLLTFYKYRDTTVQTLTLQPTVHDGVIMYEDSPLVGTLLSVYYSLPSKAHAPFTTTTTVRCCVRHCYC
jgi:hypothetical protein